MRYVIERIQPRVMHILPNFENGGLQKLIIDLIDHASDVEMTAVAVMSGGDCQRHFEARCPTVVIGNLNNDAFSNKFWFRPTPIIRLAHKIRQIQPNIVQTHTFSAAVVGRSAAKLAGVPVIIDTLHNTYDWKRSMDLYSDRLLAQFTDRIVCVSQSVRNYAVAQNPAIPASKYQVIYNGIDTKRYHPRSNREEILTRFGIGSETLVVGSVSRLVKQKRITDLIAAASDVVRHFPDVHFLVVGDGPAAEGLIRNVRDRGLEESVTFTGAIQDTENIYPACNVFTQLAEREGFGLSMAEAMASGTAVVAANTGAIAEIVQHDRNGLLYKVGDIQGLANNICTLLSSAERRMALGKQAIQDIESNFNIASVSPKYSELWSELLWETKIFDR